MEMLQIAEEMGHDYHHILGRIAAGVRSRWLMKVAVELFGIPRSRAGLAQTTATGTNLGDVLADLARNFPPLAETCIDGRSLRPGFIVNVNAERFVTSPDVTLSEGDTVLLLSLDAGG
jgi:molybdopterin converting factor small subunit